MPETALSVGASVVGGVLQKKSNDKAIDAQTQAADRAAEVQKEMFDTSRADLAPYRDTGNAANKKLAYLMGIGGYDQGSVHDKIKSKIPSLFGAAQTTTAPAAAPAAPSGAGPTDTGGVISRPVLNMSIPQRLWSTMGYDVGGNYTGFVSPKPSDPDWLPYIEWMKTLPRGANAQNPNWKSLYQGSA